MSGEYMRRCASPRARRLVACACEWYGCCMDVQVREVLLPVHTRIWLTFASMIGGRAALGHEFAVLVMLSVSWAWAIVDAQWLNSATSASSSSSTSTRSRSSPCRRGAEARRAGR